MDRVKGMAFLILSFLGCSVVFRGARWNPERFGRVGSGFVKVAESSLVFGGWLQSESILVLNKTEKPKVSRFVFSDYIVPLLWGDKTSQKSRFCGSCLSGWKDVGFWNWPSNANLRYQVHWWNNWVFAYLEACPQLSNLGGGFPVILGKHKAIREPLVFLRNLYCRDQIGRTNLFQQEPRAFFSNDSFNLGPSSIRICFGGIGDNLGMVGLLLKGAQSAKGGASSKYSYDSEGQRSKGSYTTENQCPKIPFGSVVCFAFLIFFTGYGAGLLAACKLDWPRTWRIALFSFCFLGMFTGVGSLILWGLWADSCAENGFIPGLAGLWFILTAY